MPRAVGPTLKQPSKETTIKGHADPKTIRTLINLNEAAYFSIASPAHRNANTTQRLAALRAEWRELRQQLEELESHGASPHPAVPAETPEAIGTGQ